MRASGTVLRVVGGTAGDTTPVEVRTRGRRVYTGEALARRKAWGRKWGAVGREWKAANNPKGK